MYIPYVLVGEKPPCLLPIAVKTANWSFVSKLRIEQHFQISLSNIAYRSNVISDKNCAKLEVYGLWYILRLSLYPQKRMGLGDSPPPPPLPQTKCYDPYRRLIVSVRDQQRCPLTTTAGKNYLGIDQECNSQGYEGYKVSVNYGYNIIRVLLCWWYYQGTYWEVDHSFIDRTSYYMIVACQID